MGSQSFTHVYDLWGNLVESEGGVFVVHFRKTNSGQYTVSIADCRRLRCKSDMIKTIVETGSDPTWDCKNTLSGWVYHSHHPAMAQAFLNMWLRTLRREAAAW